MDFQVDVLKGNWRIHQWDLTGGVRYQGGNGIRTAHVGRKYSGSVSSGSERFCSKIKSEMLSGSWRINLNDWGGQRSRIRVVILD